MIRALEQGKEWGIVKHDIPGREHLRRGSMGPLLEPDGPLERLKYLAMCEVLAREDMVIMNGQFPTRNPIQMITRAVAAFYAAENGDPDHLHVPLAVRLLNKARAAVESPTPPAARELELALKDLTHYLANRVKHYKSGEYFLQHAGTAILILCGSS